MSKVFAVDFDGVLTKEDKFPDIGEPNESMINLLKELKKKGHKLILWTCRTEKHLHDALWFCYGYGLEFDAVNENLQEHKDKYKNDTRKVFADYYIDDKNVSASYLEFMYESETKHINLCKGEMCCGDCEHYDGWNGKCKKSNKTRRYDEVCNNFELCELLKKEGR